MKYDKIIEGGVHDEERAFYNLIGARVVNCAFKGPADGESALKECKDIEVDGCKFCLRYPLWHAENFTVTNSEMDENARAAVWYGKNGTFKNCKLNGIKVFRECKDIKVYDCDINSPESGWSCCRFEADNCRINSEYLLLGSRFIRLKNSKLTGRYALQYIEGAHILNGDIDTKDALWHAAGATIENCNIKGEYLGWYSTGLTFINCTIDSAQPLCHCKDLTLIDCKMENCNLAFELSEVNATLTGGIRSIRTPLSGKVVADGVGEMVNDIGRDAQNFKLTLRK